MPKFFRVVNRPIKRRNGQNLKILFTLPAFRKGGGGGGGGGGDGVLTHTYAFSQPLSRADNKVQCVRTSRGDLICFFAC